MKVASVPLCPYEKEHKTWEFIDITAGILWAAEKKMKEPRHLGILNARGKYNLL